MRITLTSVQVAFGERTVLDGLSAQFDSSLSYALMGPSGAGKSTLLGVIAGLVDIGSGSRHVEPTLSESPAWVVQSSPLLPRRTALDNVALGALAVGLSRASAREAATNIMRELDITHLGAQRVSALSGGERQRVAVARSIVTDAPLILADEPTASLDRASATLVTDALLSACKLGRLVILATHDAEVANRCSQICVLENGALREV